MNDKRRYIWFAVFVLVVFVVGAAGGVVTDRLLRPPAGGEGEVRPGPLRVRHRLGVDLNLTADQQRQLDAIFAARRDRIAKIQDEMQARFMTEQKEFRDEIAKILTPDQRNRFEEWLSHDQMPGLRIPHRQGPGRGMGGPGRGRGPGS